MTPEAQFIQECFRRYYAARELEFPPDPVRREWAFMFPGRMMERHKAFPTVEALRATVRSQAPAHLFYSSAYFDRPGEPVMGKKGWRGADLFFDLDLDPMSVPPEQRTYEALLKRIQEETRKLLDFLLDDFALKSVTAVFSGQKGYHLHVRDPEVIPLSGPGRREIVDYITATGLELEGSVLYREEGSRARRLRAEGGWGRRMARRVVSLLEELAPLPEKEAVARVRSEFDFLSPAQARSLVAKGRDPKALARILERGEIDQIRGFPWAKLVERMTVPMLAKPDQLVTGDIHRLARTPTSLHGTTGLRVTPLPPDRLRDFDPLKEAVALGSDPVALEVAGEIRFRLGPERFHLGPGLHEVPEYAAAHLLAGGWQLWLPPPKRQGFSVKLTQKPASSN
jgi:DNA primase small subunit